MAPGSRRSLRLGHSRPMPIISEDDAAFPPTVPPRSPRRPFSGTGVTNYTPYRSPVQSRKSSYPDRTSAPMPKEGIWDRSGLAKRGGWYRIGLVAAVLVAITIGLAVGLTVGLRKNNQSQATASLPTDIFPAGSYSFTLALTNVSTSCSTSSSAFSCYPFNTYMPSAPNTSATRFDWIITPSTPYSYVISSSENPFAPAFTNISLRLLDGNQYTERFTFNLTMDKAAIPSTSLPGTSGTTTTCSFNTTVLTATLWTRMRASYPASITGVPDSTNASSTFAPWPYRADVQQVQAPGVGVPDCRDSNGRSVGDFHVQPSGTGDQSCRCGYMNYALPGSNSTGTS